MALVDAHFMTWLMGAEPSGTSAVVQPTSQLVRQMENVLGQSGLDLDLVRVYWYSHLPLAQPVDDVVWRTVPDPALESGLGMVRALSADLAALAHGKAADHVLLVSDDERLWSAVDAAQLGGMSVHMACDDSVNHFAQLQKDDPSWARLLAQADRRVVWALGPQVRMDSPAQEDASTAQADADGDAASILANIQDWWQEESSEQQSSLRDELRQSRSIPQEVDRELLLRLSRELGRPLSWPDKKLMREGVRRTVLGEQADAEPAGEPAE